MVRSVTLSELSETFGSIKLASGARCHILLASVAARLAVVGGELRGDEAPNSWELWTFRRLEAGG